MIGSFLNQDTLSPLSLLRGFLRQECPIGVLYKYVRTGDQIFLKRGLPAGQYQEFLNLVRNMPHNMVTVQELATSVLVDRYEGFVEYAEAVYGMELNQLPKSWVLKTFNIEEIHIPEEVMFHSFDGMDGYFYKW